jgi:hypothetical protein
MKKIIRKEIKSHCNLCDGKNKSCKFCKGNGKRKESHYYFIDEKNKIAFDGDNL